jgi:23S rRNA A1618 N6-methylase RlmF
MQFVTVCAGTGAACIYPLLGVRNSSWEFIASEADSTNAEYAIENVTKNGLADKIKGISVVCFVRSVSISTHCL